MPTKVTIKSTAQKEAELAKEIRAAQAAQPPVSQRSRFRRALEFGVKGAIHGAQAFGGTKRGII